MANWCRNFLTIEGKEKEVEEVVEFIKNDNGNKDEQIFDFNTILPSPKIFNEQDERLKDFWQSHGFDFDNKEDIMIRGWKYCQDNNLIPPESGFNSGGREWRNDNWGTRWNAYDVVLDLTKPGIVEYDFITTWTPPEPVVVALGNRFPNLFFRLYYRDLYFSWHGELVMKNGEVFNGYCEAISDEVFEDLNEPGRGYVIATPADESTINPIQKIAIDSLLDLRGYNYDQLSTGALGEVRDIDTLTNDEATKVIEYGNDLYRKDQS